MTAGVKMGITSWPDYTKGRGWTRRSNLAAMPVKRFVVRRAGRCGNSINFAKQAIAAGEEGRGKQPSAISEAEHEFD